MLEDRSQPLYMEAYLRPAESHPDQAVFEAIDDVLSADRTSRLYRSLVRDKKIATRVSTGSGLPGSKYPHLWSVFVNTVAGGDNAEVQAAVRAEIERLKSEDASEQELARFRRRARLALLNQMRSNGRMALQLAEHQRLHGDWRELFRKLDRYDRVTAADIRRVAGETFRPVNRTVARIETIRDAAAPAAGTQEKEGTR